MSEAGIVVVGAGQGGAAVVAALRQAGYAGRLTLIGDEAELPYERPPLSKDYLAGDKAFERLLLRPQAYWHEQSVVLRLGQRVERVDPATRQLDTDVGRLRYDSLVWAAGGRPRRLSCAGHDLGGVHVVRTRADIDRIRAELPAVQRVVVVGGGYVGLEAAAVLNKLGKTVVVLEAQDRVLARVAGERLSRFFEEQHRAHGVQVRTGVAVDSLVGQDARVTAVALAGGEAVPADLVIVGIGITPAVEPLLAAGARGGNGVVVDAHGRTSLEGVYALGDCALHENPHAGGAPVRLESVQNANDQALVVARALVGNPIRYEAVPWFWSTQYELRLQTVGLSGGHDRVVMRGVPNPRGFSVVYLKGGAVIALDCVNQPRDFVQGKALVARRAVVDPLQLADPAVPLKSLVA